MASHFFVLNIRSIQRSLEDIVVWLCFEHGASGVSENLKFQQDDLQYEPQTIVTDTFDLEVYFLKPPPGDLLQELKAHDPLLNIEVSEEAHRDWLEEWKKGYKPFALVEGIWVVPSWLTAPPDARHSLLIDPGMAFGTGTHETTQLAAACLHQLTQKEKLQSLLDVGTGTGILTLLAEKIGFTKIDGTEIDPVAREVAKENIGLNKSRCVTIRDDQVEDIQEKYDVVLANIIDGVLLQLEDALKKSVRPGGYLVLSGILTERAEEFVEKFSARNPFEWVGESTKGEWMGYILKRAP